MQTGFFIGHNVWIYLTNNCWFILWSFILSDSLFSYVLFWCLIGHDWWMPFWCVLIRCLIGLNWWTTVISYVLLGSHTVLIDTTRHICWSIIGGFMLCYLKRRTVMFDWSLFMNWRYQLRAIWILMNYIIGLMLSNMSC